jgi:hypothetical protein
MKEQVGEKRCTVSTHRYADCLLKNMPTKHKKYVVNQKLEHLDDISFWLFFGRIRVVFPEVVFVSLYQAYHRYGVCSRPALQITKRVHSTHNRKW